MRTSGHVLDDDRCRARSSSSAGISSRRSGETASSARYTSDGKTEVVEAIGDLDCDGQTTTYRLDVSTAGGNASVTITPPSNAD